MGGLENQTKAEYIIQQLNATNAKKVALCLVIGFIVYHGIIHLRFGQFSIFCVVYIHQFSYQILLTFYINNNIFGKNPFRY